MINQETNESSNMHKGKTTPQNKLIIHQLEFKNKIKH